MQLEKSEDESVSRLSGSVTETRLEQSSNADEPISVTPLGMETSVRLMQEAKALLPIVCKLDGNEIETISLFS